MTEAIRVIRKTILLGISYIRPHEVSETVLVPLDTIDKFGTKIINKIQTESKCNITIHHNLDSKSQFVKIVGSGNHSLIEIIGQDSDAVNLAKAEILRIKNSPDDIRSIFQCSDEEGQFIFENHKSLNMVVLEFHVVLSITNKKNKKKKTKKVTLTGSPKNVSRAECAIRNFVSENFTSRIKVFSENSEPAGKTILSSFEHERQENKEQLPAISFEITGPQKTLLMNSKSANEIRKKYDLEFVFVGVKKNRSVTISGENVAAAEQELRDLLKT